MNKASLFGSIGLLAMSLGGLAEAGEPGLAVAPPEASESGGVQLDPALPVYEAVGGVSGDLSSVGSDTMVNVMSYWGEAFNKFYPGVRCQIEGKGSSTAPPALLENQSQFGPMSRAMDPEEVDQFVEHFGYEPTALRVAIDCVGVFVHKDCPLEEISLPALEMLFSVGGDEMTWGDLGVEEPGWARRPVALYGRNSASGTYKFFKKAALSKLDYKASVKEVPGSAGVIAAIAKDPFAMGYSGVGYKTPDVKLLGVSYDTDEDAFAPSQENAMSGEYPMARFLYMYLNYDPRSEIDPLRAEFAKLVFSRQGQEAVMKDGCYPVPGELARDELGRLGIELPEYVVADEDEEG